MDYKEGVFQNLVEQVHNCHRCPRMEGRTRVFGSGNGPLHAKLLFIAEAPGRLGAELSGIPLTGDQTGRNFDALLKAAEIDRKNIFITNAVLCNPQNKQGLNASPISSEISNCSNYLHATIQLLQPRYIVTLGLIALRVSLRLRRLTSVLAKQTSKWAAGFLPMRFKIRACASASTKFEVRYSVFSRVSRSKRACLSMISILTVYKRKRRRCQ